MGRATGDEPKPNWAERLTPTGRAIALMFLGLGVIFSLGALVGFGVAMFEDGMVSHKPAAYVALAVILMLVAGLSRALWTVFRAWQNPGVSAFDRRYYRMWMIIAALGVPFGIILAAGTDFSDPLKSGSAIISNSPIDPNMAILLAVVGTIVLAASTWIYLRTVDDHEERAYLWGSTIAFHFLAIAFPVAWLLARGGLLPALGIGLAIIIVLLSFVIQTAVWLWFKFR